MTSENRRCGLGSFISMSCKGRAEAFARRLHTKLISLGSDGDGEDGVADETSWLNSGGHPVDAQPRHDVRLNDVEVTESPASEAEEEEEEKGGIIVNGDSFSHANGDDTKKPYLRIHDSDSDCSFGNEKNEADERTNDKNSDSEENSSNVQANISTSVSDSSPLHCSLLVDEPSTQSLQDEAEEDDSTSLDDVARMPENSFEDESIVDDGNETGQQGKESVGTSPSGWSDVPPTSTPEPSASNDLETTPESGGGETVRTPRVQRCSSLKTGKTPPSTPATKKIVRFADVLGLDLADVRTFLDEVPKVPVSAFEDLPDADLSDSPDSEMHSECPEVNKLLVPMFQQPAGQPYFLERVREHQVCLENALVDDPVSLSVKGTVRVRNLDFHKSVHIRYSLDAWKTFNDVQALYLSNSCDGFSDRFAFLLYANSLEVGQRLEFACRFQCKGYQYWDSNKGANYCFQCVPAAGRPGTPARHATSGVEDWGASFY